MEWNHIQKSKYFKPTKKYSYNEWLNVKHSKSIILLYSLDRNYSSKEWDIIQNSTYPSQGVYDPPPDELMF